MIKGIIHEILKVIHRVLSNIITDGQIFLKILPEMDPRMRKCP